MQVGSRAIAVRPDRPWAKLNEDANGIVYAATGWVPGAYLQALTAAEALQVLDDSCAMAGQDVCFVSADLGVKDCATGYGCWPAHAESRPPIRNARDVLKALARGAFVGRPFQYAAAVRGESGVRHLLGIVVARDAVGDNVTISKLLPEPFDTDRQEFMAQRLDTRAMHQPRRGAAPDGWRRSRPAASGSRRSSAWPPPFSARRTPVSSRGRKCSWMAEPLPVWYSSRRSGLGGVAKL